MASQSAQMICFFSFRALLSVVRPPTVFPIPARRLPRAIMRAQWEYTCRGGSGAWDVRRAAREYHAASALASCRVEDPAVGLGGLRQHQWQ